MCPNQRSNAASVRLVPRDDEVNNSWPNADLYVTPGIRHERELISSRH
jgi:hypothetical protein